MRYLEAKKYILQRLRNELSPNLYYHGLQHTLDILKSAISIGKQEKISRYEMQLLKTSALFHDSGFMVSKKEHEKKSCKLAREALPQFQFSTEEIKRICGMIMATRIPQTPKNHLEEIICDADLDYLGTDDYANISAELFKELNHRSPLSQKDWLNIQVKFLEDHHYFTSTARKLRASKKTQTLRKLKAAANKTKT